MKIQENIALAQWTTFKIGGIAKYFVEVENVEDSKEALQLAKDTGLDFFVLGGGSNILVNDGGIEKLVIKVNFNEFKIDNNSMEIESGSGVPLSRLVKESAENGLSGMEWAIGVPGTVGGALRGNAGAFGGDMSSLVKEVSVLDVDNLEVKNFKKDECNFSYRNSIFKENQNLIILSAVFGFEKREKETIQELMDKNLEARKKKQPEGISSAGSFFKNPKADEKTIALFEKESGEKSRDGKVPAGWLIDQVGMKGKKVGGAMVSEDNANFIINSGNATAQDVAILASVIKQKVRNEFGIQLQEEVQYLGF